MVYYIRLGLVLFVIAAFASGILAFVNGLTKPIIEENQRQLEIEARRVVLPQATMFEFIDGNFPYFRGLDDDGKLVGYTFMSTGVGYSGDIQTMVGVTSDFLVSNIAVISQTETPGLGANCVRQDFTSQFQGKSKDELMLDKDGGSIVSITGATISSRALCNSVYDVLKQLMEQINDADEKTDTKQTLSAPEEAA